MILINIKNSNDEVYSFGSVYAPNNLQQRIQFITECNNPASTTYETNKGPKWVLIWGFCGRPIWAPVSFCKWFSDGTNMVYQ